MKKNNELSLGFSPCPNDTFMFYGLVHGKIATEGLSFGAPVLDDVEQLNLLALQKKLDVTKLSFHALGHVLDEYCVLSSGSALGRGCGPLLVTTGEGEKGSFAGRKIAIPGKLTTAALLLQMYLEETCELVEMRFDLIMDAVSTGKVDGGVIIHESRFTYKEFGLTCVQDLGQWWENLTGMPIPLGCIAARRSLGKKTIKAIERAVRASVAYGFQNSQECMPYIRRYSQELAPEVVQSHIDLYVNEFSRDLGAQGLAAIDKFIAMGRENKVLPPGTQQITV
ncbi:1,4-dihydroxy-6-naphthoate synthase [Desulforhopalus singaporensis]|uniref:1,4-dihydroxy-6-naphtoate synthase n=1 Tax=Desulforhopalus singaporensis TaxID=91360 RepID=A0A1H0TH13_9BACT|nr:1,4-dihydroxy-6-naphthoate synthase [Desulforhopalus singaporensis]SDP52858.1 1,4-dihydroxy-6-naphthoate synthase [Desulforhopalus singaporensis]